jgi:flagellar biosynthetic protein FliP
VNHDGLQPYLHGTKTQSQAWNDGVKPLRTWMLAQTRKDDLSMLTQVANEQQVKQGQDVRPKTPDDVPLTTLIPAFVLSELKSAFIIGFVIFVPFLVIDLVVSSSLMSLGMMMVPPVLVSLPFKILLFVMVDGWALIVHSVVMSYR